MDQARSTISKIFNGEPRSYTRFNLTQNMEGDNSQVEMKLSSDMDEEVGGNGVGEHLNHTAPNGPYVARRPGRTPKNICFMAATTLLIFIIGYLIGYLVHGKKPFPSPCPTSQTDIGDNEIIHETGAAPLMDWDDVKALLANKLAPSNFEAAFSEFASNDHKAGSFGDEALANKVMRRFKEYGMLSWNDEHFVKIQEGPPAPGFNQVSFKGKEERPSGFLSYSATGKQTGAVLYAYYGQTSDFRLLKNKNLNMTGRVILVRAGKISFAEKVANAASMNAAAVLIYPDPDDYPIGLDTELYGHVHLGSGDPYTPGFPSFNHTQFPPLQSSGLPEILAQTITGRTAENILSQLGGEPVPSEWGGVSKLGDENDVITVEVNNIMTQKNINNVFGVIKGYVDPDRYVVIGAQRDAWGPGFAKSTVGTSILVELARCISEMVKEDGFKPRRSIVFASWSGGEYGNIGATEWLEGYLSSLHMKAFSYINLDGVVAGQNGFKASASPMMYSLIESTLKEVKVPNYPAVTLYEQNAKASWETNVMEPMQVDNPAYPFLTFAGVPSASFRLSSTSDYLYYGTMLDTRKNLDSITSSQTPQMTVAAAQFAGHMALRLVHDHLLRLNVQKYENIIRAKVLDINRKVKTVQRMRPDSLPQALTVQWLITASGSYNRASRNLKTEIENSDLEDIEMCRIINDRIMRVEKSLLSPYVSPTSKPFRHILIGSGSHTLTGLLEHLEDLRVSNPTADANLFREQFALATWTIQGCANALAGDIWALDNEV